MNPQKYPEELTKRFQHSTDKLLDFNNLTTFSEKLQWLKIYDATPLKSRLTDKYLVRDYVKEKIGEEYLVPLLGVWNNFSEINFDKLPAQFVLKCNHGLYMRFPVRDKKNFNKQRARERFAAWLNYDFSTLHLELHYTGIDRKIIAEDFIIETDSLCPSCYKFWCFDGKPHCCQCTTGRGTDRREDYFDLDWQHLDYVQNNRPNNDSPEKIPKPKNFELMKELAAKLAEGFPFVRVDLHEIKERVYFGDMTFTPGEGIFYFKSEGTDEYLGSLLNLPALTNPPALVEISEYHFRQNFLYNVKVPKSADVFFSMNHKIIASLTSWTKRIGTAHLAIQTILNQTRQPDLTVLYLATEEFPQHEDNLPKELLALRSERFEIRWTHNIRSYKKLIPALKDFHDDVIITFDDDLIFNPELIERLLVGYRKYPDLINCHRIRNILFDAKGNAAYSKVEHAPYDQPSYLNKLSGGAGCLYPPHCLHEDVLDEEKFMTLAPTNDDLWFWCMSILNGRRINVLPDNIDRLDFIPDTQDVGLNKINNFEDKLFFRDLQNILNAYPLLRDILYYEQFLVTGN